MSAPVWCHELAGVCWAAVAPPPFPRDLRRAAVALALNVIPLPGLSIATILRWFEAHDISLPPTEPDRPLRGCLVAFRGKAFAFVNSDDAADEQRFTVAHELAHFLRDYLRPRQRAKRRLGAKAIDVLDGKRPPTADERIAGLLRGTPLAPFFHLLHRDGGTLSDTEREAEEAADRLAYELLAPAELLADFADRTSLEAELVSRFGLPPVPAARYAGILLPDPPRLDISLERLLRM